MRAFVYAVVISTLAISALTAGCNIGRSSPVYNQCDPRWGSTQLGSSSTICKVGCLMCSVASALTGLGRKVNQQTPTPEVLNFMLRGNYGYQGNLFVWTAVERYNIKYEGQFESTATIQKALCDKKVVILLVNGGGHWVLELPVYQAMVWVLQVPCWSRSKLWRAPCSESSKTSG